MLLRYILCIHCICVPFTPHLIYGSGRILVILFLETAAKKKEVKSLNYTSSYTVDV